ncbi:MAG: UDP-N-acetylmuramoyl-tripeptide-D-alanyl-D-alanine ligase MurF [Parcubacteria group bacterium GW2011_GWB1_43_8b]|nr:MAG: UDP-N-acetylmuramoyl-tripeptide-D-alanyl-D-alanine ligase MurF [Parcubacteria group bacterium GW2011_GWB1_43_8b]
MKRLFIRILRFKIGLLAKLTIWRFKPFIIAITGSAGKTSAKEAIFAVLKNYKRVRRSWGNFNSDLGVPLTILGDFNEKDLNLFSRNMPAGANKFKKLTFLLKVILSAFIRVIGLRSPSQIFQRKTWEGKSAYRYPEILVLEYGADKPGDIQELIKIAKPDIGIITAIGQIPVHVEFYPSVEAVVREKANLISDLFTSDLVVINGDDPWLENLEKRTRARVKTFGTSSDCDIKISHFGHLTESGKIKGITFKLEKEGKSVPVDIADVFSISHAYASACAAVVAEHFDINLVSVADDISKYYRPVSGRSVILDGKKNIQIIDESYNSSPLALKTALETLKMVSGRRKVAVLGDMTELGQFTQKAHEMIGEIISECVGPVRNREGSQRASVSNGVDVLITVGEKAKIISDRAVRSGFSKSNTFFFDSITDSSGINIDTIEKIKEILQEGDLILVKGSHSVGLEKVVEKIKKL